MSLIAVVAVVMGFFTILMIISCIKSYCTTKEEKKKIEERNAALLDKFDNNIGFTGNV